jgi:hypothetical protein
MAAFKLREDEEESVISFVVGVRHVLRRAYREGKGSDDVLSAYSLAVVDWPPQRRRAALALVEAALAPAPPLSFVPGRVNGDGIGHEGAA